jgi:hypothetical protein
MIAGLVALTRSTAVIERDIEPGAIDEPVPDRA